MAKKKVTEPVEKSKGISTFKPGKNAKKVIDANSQERRHIKDPENNCDMPLQKHETEQRDL